MPAIMSDEMRFRVLRLLQENPEATQRDIAKALSISLGSINFVLNALIDRGLIMARNFSRSDNKMRYAYYLTPKGASEKAALTGGFLRRKLVEYEALKAEIELLSLEAGAGDLGTERSS